MVQRIALLVFPGFQMLDATGPASVFGGASEAVAGAYAVTLLSGAGGPVNGLCGLSLTTTALGDAPPGQFDSFFIVGGNEAGIAAAIAQGGLRRWATVAAGLHARYGSICSGSVILAAWGLIGTRRFATHWRAAAEMRRRWPQLQLDPEAIFVEDGALWTSAGVTTGIDMALAMVERDHGPALAQAIAQRLVLATRRPGWQSQFSPALQAQVAEKGRYSGLANWLDEHVDEAISVETMADYCHESLRSFHRNFTAAMGQTPAQFLTRQRVDRARALIGEGQALKQVAVSAGFGDVARLSAAFRKTLGLSAHEWRVLHGQRRQSTFRLNTK
jgi:transcriptional regulator GlxA family with amidase domain